MKLFKKSFSLLLIAILLVSAMSISAFASEDDFLYNPYIDDIVFDESVIISSKEPYDFGFDFDVTIETYEDFVEYIKEIYEEFSPGEDMSEFIDEYIFEVLELMYIEFFETDALDGATAEKYFNLLKAEGLFDDPEYDDSDFYLDYFSSDVTDYYLEVPSDMSDVTADITIDAEYCLSVAVNGVDVEFEYEEDEEYGWLLGYGSATIKGVKDGDIIKIVSSNDEGSMTYTFEVIKEEEAPKPTSAKSEKKPGNGTVPTGADETGIVVIAILLAGAIAVLLVRKKLDF